MSLATIYSNKKIYESLKIHCSNESLNVLDKANGYTALDYANALQRSFVDHSNNTKFHHYNVPGSFYYLICSVCTNDWGELFIKTFKSFGPFMIVSSIVKLLDQHIHRFPFFWNNTQRTKNIVKGFVLFLSFVPGVIMGDYLPTKEYCQEYTYYQQTNISAPREFTELKHFEKYINIYGNSPHIVCR